MKKNITPELALKLENIEATAWQDMVEAANQDFKKTFGLNIDVIDGDTYISCPAIPFVHFNCVLGFGVKQPANADNINKLLAYFNDKGLSTVYLYIIDGLNKETEQLIKDIGFAFSGSWERTWRDDKPLDEISNTLKAGWHISKVDTSTADAWAGFVSGTYQMAPTKNWLLDFAVREGWHHYILRDAGSIIAVRSIIIGKDGMAFWGVEAPIPGLMTNDYAMDYALAYYIVKEGLQMGVKGFVGDIEAVSDTMDTPAYNNFKTLGFSIPYRRMIYKLK